MQALPQEIIDTVVDFICSKSELESLSLTHSCFLPATRRRLFATIRLLHGKCDSSLNYGSTRLATKLTSSRKDPKLMRLSSFLSAFQSVTQNSLITSSVRTFALSLFAGPGSIETNEIPNPDDFLPFTNLHALQVRFAHLYHDVIDARTTQKWRLPRLIQLIQMNSSLQHLAIDTCSLEPPAWAGLFSCIMSLSQLHTFVLRAAAIASKQPNFDAEGSLSLNPTVVQSRAHGLENQKVLIPVQLKRLYLEGNEPELERVAISTSQYVSILQLNALTLRCCSNIQIWGHRAVLRSCAHVLTNLTIDIGMHYDLDNTLRDLTFPRLTYFQLISPLDGTFHRAIDWLGRANAESLRYLHLKSRDALFSIIENIDSADNRLFSFISSTPSLRLVTADIVLTEYGLISQSGTECLERNLPKSYGTGMLKHGKMEKWWKLRSTLDS